MQQFTSPSPYIRQISIYLKQEKYLEARELSENFADSFPDNMTAHLLFAKSAFWTGDFAIARDEAKKAYGTAEGTAEVIMAGILLACSYYRLGEYEKGLKLVRTLSEQAPHMEELPTLKFAFAMATGDESMAARSIELLYEVDRKAGRRLLENVLLGGA